jgi:hypothetical protein
MLVPVRRRTRSIISLSACPIILPLITKQLPETPNRHTIPDQRIPVIVTDFMPEMPQQRSVPLPQVELMTHPLRFIRLFNIDRDKAVIMPRHHPLPGRDILLKIEYNGLFLPAMIHP